ncbi:hypothetical protein [Saccharothrix sp. NRRL B-16348]|uniref:hypothetical protein n=1 Tax=Saccharothrix sp. NRRL B-16348 TaxID=1415542 RepID=UPI0012FA418C|nr:hypothetical protein [Saccharothrix sp. NRRL B-16348]
MAICSPYFIDEFALRVSSRGVVGFPGAVADGLEVKINCVSWRVVHDRVILVGIVMVT